MSPPKPAAVEALLKGDDEADASEKIRHYSRAIEIDPEYAQAYAKRGAVYIVKVAINRAIKDFDKAIELKPDLTEAYFDATDTSTSP